MKLKRGFESQPIRQRIREWVCFLSGKHKMETAVSGQVTCRNYWKILNPESILESYRQICREMKKL